jgi:hypothetical protein
MQRTVFVVGILVILVGLLLLFAPGLVVPLIVLYDHSSQLLPAAVGLVMVGGALSVIAARSLGKNS